MVLEFRSAQLSWSFVQQLATRTFPLAATLAACYCFVLPALLCCNVVFRVNLLRILLTYFCLWIFDFVRIMPSQSSKSPQAPSTKTHSFLRKSTDESPSFKTTSTSVPSEVKTSQSTNSLSPRSDQSNHPEEDDVISDDEKIPEERAAAELRANRCRGCNPNSSLDENNTSFLSGVGSSLSSTPSLERAIKKKKIQSDSDSDEPSSTQQVVYRKGQSTATPILS